MGFPHCRDTGTRPSVEQEQQWLQKKSPCQPNLFKLFTHRIEFRTDDRITILHGPNGVGKTTVLGLLQDVFRPRSRYWDRIEFDSIEIEFVDGGTLKITPEKADTEKKSSIAAKKPSGIQYEYKKGKGQGHAIKQIYGKDDDDAPVGFPSKTHRWNLKFNELEFARFVDRKTLTVSSDKALTTVLNNTDGARHLHSEVSRQIANNPNLNQHDLLELCCGHDLVQILAIGLRHALGNNEPKAMTRENVERMLRLAYDAAMFALGSVFASIRAWERANPGYQVLP